MTGYEVNTRQSRMFIECDLSESRTAYDWFKQPWNNDKMHPDGGGNI